MKADISLSKVKHSSCAQIPGIPVREKKKIQLLLIPAFSIKLKKIRHSLDNKKKRRQLTS